MKIMDVFIMSLLAMVFIFSFSILSTSYHQTKLELKELNTKYDKIITLNKDCANDYNELQSKYSKLKQQNNKMYNKYIQIVSQQGTGKLNCLSELKEEIYNRYNYTEEFRCLNFSRVFKKEALEKCNITAPIVYGQLEEKDNKSLHAWNRVYLDIDPTFNEWYINREVYNFKGEWKGD